LTSLSRDCALDSGKIRLDLNEPKFQNDLFRLTKEQQTSLLGTLRKLSQMTWRQLYQDPGLKWESITSRKGFQREHLYSFRLGKGFRAIAFREGDWLTIVSLHPDHDSAYK
jgi:hypothetical protein